MKSFDQKDLIQINITGVYSRFCDVPMANNFFTTAKRANQLTTKLECGLTGPHIAMPTTGRLPRRSRAGQLKFAATPTTRTVTTSSPTPWLKNLRTHKAVAWPLNSPSPQLTALENQSRRVAEISRRNPPGQRQPAVPPHR